MTYAPADLLAVQTFCHQHTGQSAAELGIAGDAAHRGGYHCGSDRIVSGDYSVVESSRDRSGLTLAASAFDLGGNFARFREITLGIIAACKRNDPRTRDIREVIFTPDGKTVQRWDRLGRRSGGDASHLSHTHLSFFRDSEGRRHLDDNFLGLLRQLFTPTSTGGTDMAGEADRILNDTLSPNNAILSLYERLATGTDSVLRARYGKDLVTADPAAATKYNLRSLSDRLDALAATVAHLPPGDAVDVPTLAADLLAILTPGLSALVTAAVRAGIDGTTLHSPPA